MMDVLGGATDQGENSSARIVQDASGFTQRGRPFLKRTFFFLNDFSGSAVNSSRDVVDIEIHGQRRGCNFIIQRFQGVRIILAAICHDAAASIRASVCALNGGNAVTFGPFLHKQTFVDIRGFAPGFQELQHYAKLRQFFILREHFPDRVGQFP